MLNLANLYKIENGENEIYRKLAIDNSIFQADSFGHDKYRKFQVAFVAHAKIKSLASFNKLQKIWLTFSEEEIYNYANICDYYMNAVELIKK